MNATQVLDTLEAKGPPELAAELTRGLTDAAMSEAKALRALDSLMYPLDPDQAARQRSRSIFKAWQAWADDAEHLLRHIHRLKEAGLSIPHADELRDWIGFARAMLKLTLDDVERARKQVRAGQTLTGEEIRSELHLPSGR